MEIEHIRQELASKIQKIDSIGKKLKFNLDGHFILIDGSEGINVLSNEDADADCTITMSIDTYLKLQKKEIKPLIATLTGKLKIKGDIALAQKLKQLS